MQSQRVNFNFYRVIEIAPAYGVIDASNSDMERRVLQVPSYDTDRKDVQAFCKCQATLTGENKAVLRHCSAE